MAMIYSALSGKPFDVVVDTYPDGELPRLSDEDIDTLRRKKERGEELDETERALVFAEQARAQRKIAFYKESPEIASENSHLPTLEWNGMTAQLHDYTVNSGTDVKEWELPSDDAPYLTPSSRGLEICVFDSYGDEYVVASLKVEDLLGEMLDTHLTAFDDNTADDDGRFFAEARATMESVDRMASRMREHIAMERAKAEQRQARTRLNDERKCNDG